MRATVGLVLGGGLVLLAPLIPALAAGAAPLLLAGLVVLGLLAALLRGVGDAA